MAGFTSKELDTETSLYYGVYPALGGSARYCDAWSGTWMSVDPLAKKYPGWSRYAKICDDTRSRAVRKGLDKYATAP